MVFGLAFSFVGLMYLWMKLSMNNRVDMTTVNYD